MAKKIYMTDADVEAIVGELRGTLSGMRCYGNIDIKRSFKADERCAFIYFTVTAWAKMTTLMQRFTGEVQWHGRVRRISEQEFEVYDILVPPHEVSPTTVISDYKPYGEWLDGLDDDTFNSVRFHGHSHVDMQVQPSATDEKYRLDLVTQLPKPTNGSDVFYIFMIINKRHEWSAEIYDFTNNALYSTDDIGIDTILGEEGNGMEGFIAEAKKVAVARTYSGTYYGGQRAYGTPYSNRAYAHSVSSAPADAYGVPSKQPAQSTQPTKVTPVSELEGSGKGKGKGKKNGGGGKCCGFDTWQEYYEAVCGDDPDDTPPATSPSTDKKKSVNNDSETDDDNNPNSPFYVREWGYQ